MIETKANPQNLFGVKILEASNPFLGISLQGIVCQVFFVN